MIDCHHNYARLHEVLTLVAFAVYLSMVLLSIAYQKKTAKRSLCFQTQNMVAILNSQHLSPLVDVIIPNMPAKATKKKSRPIVTNY